MKKVLYLIALIFFYNINAMQTNPPLSYKQEKKLEAKINYCVNSKDQQEAEALVTYTNPLMTQAKQLILKEDTNRELKENLTPKSSRNRKKTNWVKSIISIIK